MTGRFPSGSKRRYNQTGSDVWDRMLSDEGDQQEEDCYNGDEDASRDPRSVETRSHAKRIKTLDAYYTFHRSTRLCVGSDMSRDEMQTTSPAESLSWQHQVPGNEDVPRRHGTNRSKMT